MYTQTEPWWTHEDSCMYIVHVLWEDRSQGIRFKNLKMLVEIKTIRTMIKLQNQFSQKPFSFGEV